MLNSSSETHYSLKEMETPTSKTGTDFNKSNVGNPLLSERDGNSPKRSKVPWISFIMSETHYSLKEMETLPLGTHLLGDLALVGNPLLSERDGNFCSFRISSYCCFCGRKPTTLWKRWKLHYTHLLLIQYLHLVGNPLLSERDGNSSLHVGTSNTNSTVSETHYSLKEMETRLTRTQQLLVY